MVTVRRIMLLGLFEPQLDQKKIPVRESLHCRAQKESKGLKCFLNFSAQLQGERTNSK